MSLEWRGYVFCTQARRYDDIYYMIETGEHMTTTAVASKQLSTTEMSRRATAFVAKWKKESRENAEAQSWWNDFFGIFGVDRYSKATFERVARRASTGNKGRIDVFMPGVMIAEHKSLGKDGGKAENQADDYLAGGDIRAVEMPRYIVSTDFAEVQITDLQSPEDPPFRFPIAKLPRHISRFAFLAGYDAPVRATVEQKAVSIKAARKMGELYEALLGDLDANEDGHDAEQAAVFMTRILFLMYGDDVDGLWERDSFQRFIEECTVEDGSDTGPQISYLFQILNKEKGSRPKNLDDRLAGFPYVNGGIFHEKVDIPTFTRPMREALLDAMKVEWSAVTPAIFGSLMQGMSTREKRRVDGEHYTSEDHILRVLRPLFLDEIEEKLQAAWPSERELVKLHESFADMRYLDPASGSGNFIIVAYREMRDVELRLLVRLRELRGETRQALDGTWVLNVSPEQFAGIEINGWPAAISAIAFFLTDHQANQRMALELGSAPDRLPIKHAAHIVHGNALDVDWNEASPATGPVYVMGNPPYIGQKEKTDEQVEDMKRVWGKRYDGYLDYVTGWHAKALAYLKDAPGSRFAFVTTNSITQGQPVASLFKPILGDGWRIRFAHRTFGWTSEATGAAAVHCVIVGFDKETTPARLFDYKTPRSEPLPVDCGRINPYLIDGPDVYIRKRSNRLLSPDLPPVNVGSKALDWGHLTITEEEYPEVSQDPVIAKYLRPFVGGDELINGTPRWCIWLKDVEPADLGHRALKVRIDAIGELRRASKDDAANKAAKLPALFQNDRQPTTDYLGIPNSFSETREYMTAARLPVDTIAGIKLFTAEDPDGFLFAAISSTMFMTWQKMVGGRIKSDPSFSNTIVLNNYPLPEVSDAERLRLAEAGQAVVLAREEYPDLTLAELYNPRGIKPGLLKAHDALDKVTDRLFGFAKTPTLSQRQERLFALFVKMDAAATLMDEAEKATKRAAARAAAKAKREAAKLAAV